LTGLLGIHYTLGYLDYVLGCRSYDDEDEDEQHACLEGFIEALNNF
jgi:hypothetical protein